MAQNINGPGIHAQNTPNPNGSPPGIAVGKSPSKKRLWPFFAVAAAAVAGAVWLMSGEDEYIYDPNMGGYDTGVELGNIDSPLGRMWINKLESGGGAPRYSLNIQYNIPENIAPEDVTFPLPTNEQIQKLLDKIPELSSPDQIDKIYGHTPFLPGTQGLARIEMGRYFGAGYVINNDQLYDTGYGEYKNEYDKARPEVDAFMIAARANGYQALSCSYDLGDYATRERAGSQLLAMHWYDSKPAEARTYKDNLETIGRMYEGFWQHDEKEQLHPFLEIRYPRTDCPTFYQPVKDPYTPK